MNPIVVVAGTRPEHLKVAEVIRELRGCGRTVRYVWTGQHTSPSLAADVFAATDGPYPDVVLSWPTATPRPTGWWRGCFKAAKRTYRGRTSVIAGAAPQSGQGSR